MNPPYNHTDAELTLFHAPNTRSSGVRVLLEELGASYQLHPIDMKANKQRAQDYLAVNPMGKVPAIKHGETLITEQVAIYIYLADLFPEAGLAPGLRDPQRGAYLRWLAFYGSCFEPAMCDLALKREPVPPATCPYGDCETTLKTLNDQLARGPYMLGAQFSAADVLWGSSLTWMTMFGLLPETPDMKAYIDRVNQRPSIAHVRQQDAELSAVLAAARDAT